MRLKGVVLTILVAVFLSGTVFAGGGSQREPGGLTLRPGVLTVGVDISYPPMEYFGPDGVTATGFDIEMTKIIAQRLGLTPDFVNSSWEGIFAGVDTNRYDAVISSVTVTPARVVVHNFSKPYVANTLALVLLKGSTITAQSPEELGGLNVAFQVSTTSDFFMEELAARTGLNYIARRYETVMRCFDELRLGRVDAIVTDLLVAHDYVAPANNPFEIVWRSGEPELFAICMKKGNNALTEAIDRVLEDMFDDGTMLKLSQDIFGMDFVTAARESW